MEGTSKAHCLKPSSNCQGRTLSPNRIVGSRRPQNVIGRVVPLVPRSPKLALQHRGWDDQLNVVHEIGEEHVTESGICHHGSELSTDKLAIRGENCGILLPSRFQRNENNSLTRDVDNCSPEDDEVGEILDACSVCHKSHNFRSLDRSSGSRARSGRVSSRSDSGVCDRRAHQSTQASRRRSRSIDYSALSRGCQSNVDFPAFSRGWTHHADFARYGISVGSSIPHGNWKRHCSVL